MVVILLGNFALEIGTLLTKKTVKSIEVNVAHSAKHTWDIYSNFQTMSSIFLKSLTDLTKNMGFTDQKWDVSYQENIVVQHV